MKFLVYKKFSRRGLEITLTSRRWNMLFSTKLPLPLPQIHTIITLLMSHTVESWLPLGPWSTGYELCHWAEFMSGGTENMVNIWEPQLNSLGTIVLELSLCDAPGLLTSFIGMSHPDQIQSIYHFGLYPMPILGGPLVDGWMLCWFWWLRNLLSLND